MNSIWGDGGAGDPETVAEKIRASAEEEGVRRPSTPPRLSRPPPGASPEEMRVYEILKMLRGSSDLVHKARIAERMLEGEYGIKNELLAKLLMGPDEFKEVVMSMEGGGKIMQPPLIELLSYDIPEVRVKAARVLGEKGDARALEELYAGLEEDEYWVRNAFAEAIGKMAKRIDDARTLHEIAWVLREMGKNFCGVGHFAVIAENRLREAKRSEKISDGELVTPPPRWAVISERRAARPERGDTTLKIKVESGKNERPGTTMPIKTLGARDGIPLGWQRRTGPGAAPASMPLTGNNGEAPLALQRQTGPGAAPAPIPLMRRK